MEGKEHYETYSGHRPLEGIGVGREGDRIEEIGCAWCTALALSARVVRGDKQKAVGEHSIKHNRSGETIRRMVGLEAILLHKKEEGDRHDERKNQQNTLSWHRLYGYSRVDPGHPLYLPAKLLV